MILYVRKCLLPSLVESMSTLFYTDTYGQIYE